MGHGVVVGCKQHLIGVHPLASQTSRPGCKRGVQGAGHTQLAQVPGVVVVVAAALVVVVAAVVVVVVAASMVEVVAAVVTAASTHNERANLYRSEETADAVPGQAWGAGKLGSDAAPEPPAEERLLRQGVETEPSGESNQTP